MAGELERREGVKTGDEVKELRLQDNILCYLTMEEETPHTGQTRSLLQDGGETGLADLQLSQSGEEEELHPFTRHQAPGYLLGEQLI